MAMTTSSRFCRPLLGVGLLAVGLLSACGGGSSGSSGSFQLTSISVSNGFTWKLNRPIRFTFSEAVDFTTVNNNSISIRQVLQTSPEILGDTALGSFAKLSSSVVEWRPACPTNDDLSNGGLKLGAQYVIRVLGEAGGSGIAVESVSNKVLKQSQTRFFFTPEVDAPQNAKFEDILPNEGPRPAFELIDNNADGIPDQAEHLTYVEKGGLPTNIVRFTTTNVGGDGILDELQDINLFSDQSSRRAVVVRVNQPVDPSAANISTSRIRLEFQPIGSSGAWQTVAGRVSLVNNCTATGANIRLEPSGLLPQGSNIRVVITSEFRDLAGNGNPQDQSADFVFPTRKFENAVFAPQSVTDAADEVLESFVFAGTDFESLEDEDPAFAVPLAKWGNGRLEASFEFEGTGGPFGTFDLLVPANSTLPINTTFTNVQGGPNFNLTTTQAVVNGVLNVRNLRIEENGVLQATGSNPLIIQATGTVEIFGRIDVNGGPAKDVATLDTGHLPEAGASGTAGGGKGGDASKVTDNSTPRGDNGAGAFNVANLGGRGGESAFNAQNNKNFRRPGGGGGGAFGPAVENTTDPAVAPTKLTSHYRQTNAAGVLTASPGWGFTPTPGREGNPSGKGAITGQAPALGGERGPFPFFDGISTNDFWGTQIVEVGGQTTVVQGELSGPLAGAGGGGGGDAIRAGQFPSPNWKPEQDEKGGGGGGGAGQLQVLALKDIVFGPVGAIEARGGRGASGENTINFDHVGGSGGGGSGGHVILQTPARIDFSSCVTETTAYGLAMTQITPMTVETVLPRAISAHGGRGAEAASNNVDINGSFVGQGAGGDGGAGIIQLHVLSVDNILLPVGIPANRLNFVTEPAPVVLVPTFGGVSRARSKWIALGGADLNPDSPASPDQVRFRFDGTVPSGSAFADAADVDPGTDVITSVGHGFANGDQVRVESDGTLPGGLDLSTTYFVVGATADTFQLSLLSGGMAFDITSAGTGTHRFFDPDAGLVEATGGSVQALPPLLSGVFLPGSIQGTQVVLDGSSLLGTTDDIYLRNPNLLREFALFIDGAEFNVAAASNSISTEGSSGVSILTLTLGSTVPPSSLTYQLVPRYFRVVTNDELDSLPIGTSIRIEFQGTQDDGDGNPLEPTSTPFLVPWTADIEAFNAALTEQVKFFRFRVTFDIGEELTADTPTPALQFVRVPFIF